jgi:HAD superfamily hydrolase (TIGR01549 family)
VFLLKLKVILFDLDDTLLDLKEASLVSFNKALMSHNLRPVSLEEMLSYWCRPWMEVIKSVMGSEKIPDEIRRSIGIEYMHRFNEIHLTYSRIYPDAYDTLSSIHGMGLPIGIVSRRPRIAIEEELKKFGLTNFVNVIVGSDDVRDHKPSPSPVLLATTLLNVLPCECALVGDSPDDVQAGELAGVITISVMTGPCKKDAVRQHPEIIMENLSFLIPMLKKLNFICHEN